MAGEKEKMLRKLGMWMLELPGFRKISLVCSAFYGMATGVGRDKRTEVVTVLIYLGYSPVYEGNGVRE